MGDSSTYIGGIPHTLNYFINDNMKKSLYNFDIHQSGYTLLFNSRTSEVVVMTEQMYADFCTYSLDEKVEQAYLQRGFYFSDNTNEFSEIQNASINNSLKKEIHKYRILTTSACNATCFYCYEKGLRGYTMKERTALDTAKFIVEHIKSGEKLRIEWFGGEPLLNIKAIDVISSYLKENLPEGIDYYSTIVTNGSRITKTIIDKMVNNWTLKRAQITIDGVGSKYEDVKGFGLGSFDRIINIISCLIEAKIKIDIRVNYDKSNLEDIKEVIHFFSRYKYRDQITLYAAKIFSVETSRGYFDLEEETLEIETLLHALGFKKGTELLPRTFVTGCMATFPGFYTIDPDRKLFKCDRKLLDGNIVASVSDYKEENLYKHRWNDLEVDSKCESCSLYPMCWGGCLYDRLNGIYPCYLTHKIVKHNLKMLLDDYLKAKGLV